MKNESCCIDCGVDVYAILEYNYMLTTTSWIEAGFTRPYLSGDGLICIGCLENRLGRQLVREDFNMEVPINGARFIKSERLSRCIQ